MSDSFVPFRPKASATAPGNPARFQTRILPPAAAKPFVPVSEAAAAPAAPACAGEPRVSLRREGDRITHIEVHCACGRHLEIECVY
jgi:hypothetical protein